MTDSNSSQIRTVEVVRQLAIDAKLCNDELHPYTQCLEFASELLEDFNDVRLLELNSELLRDLHEGDSFVVRGDPNDSSVLCTKDKTYSIKGAETSNALLLLPNLLAPESFPKDGAPSTNHVKVLSTQYKYLELKLSQPKLQRLLTLLNEHPYSDNSQEDEGYFLSDILDHVQGSEEEILKRLTEIKAYKINGYWRMLEFDYHFRILSTILNHIESTDLPLNAVPKRECLDVLQHTEPLRILERCFELFFTHHGEKNDSGEPRYRINEDDVCRICAEVLLKPAGKFNLDDFLSIWQQSVPEGLCTSLAQLEGVALVNKADNPPIIWHYPESKLPEDLTERFNILFDVKEKWTLEEIRSYLKEFACDRAPITALLTKFARSSMQDGKKYFSRRYPK